MRTVHTLFIVLSSLLVLALAACGQIDPDGASPSVVGAALTTANGSNLNGSNLNGSNLNGSNLNGSNLNGQALAETLVHVEFAGTKLSGSSLLDATWLEGTVFHGTKGTNSYSGLDFKQAEMVGVKGDGERVRLRLIQVHPDASGIWTYEVHYRDNANTGWWPICKNDDGTAGLAIPVNGRWSYEHGVPGGGAKTADPATFTFACRGRSAIAKCVDIGYRPWNSTTVDRHHQSCVRLIRADFCGDGTSYTTDGEWVNLYDGIGIQQDTEEWVFEAEWDEDGARCFSPVNRSHAGVPCYDARAEVGCGSQGFSFGALLINETPEDGMLD